MLDKDALKQRIDAARTLRGYTQAELADLLHEDGFGKHDLGRAERGEPGMFNANMRRALAHHLRVPENWFIDEDLAFDAAGELPEIINTKLEHIETLVISHMSFVREHADQATQVMIEIDGRLTQTERIASLSHDALGDVTEMIEGLRDAVASLAVDSLRQTQAIEELAASDRRAEPPAEGH